MIYPDVNADLKYARFLQRVLVLDSQVPGLRLLVQLLKDLGARSVFAETSAKAALITAQEQSPQMIFIEYSGSGWDGIEFARTVRRSELRCRKSPIVMVSSEATAQAILGARDAGVHEFLRKPYTMGDLIRRIEAVTARPRGWVEAVQYVGPDRRRFNSAEYTGPRKRRSDQKADSDAGRLEQALRILKAALEAIERDPRQAMRAMQAQAVDLLRVAASLADAKLAAGAAQLQLELDEIAKSGSIDGPKLRAAARPLLLYLPTGARASAVA